MTVDWHGPQMGWVDRRPQFRSELSYFQGLNQLLTSGRSKNVSLSYDGFGQPLCSNAVLLHISLTNN